MNGDAVTLQRPKRHKPHVYWYEDAQAGLRILVKDYGHFGLGLRRIARFLVRREIAALQALDASGYAPHFVRRLNAYAFAMSFVEGQRLNVEALRGRPEAPLLLARLAQIVQHMHTQAGLVHNDLSTKNILRCGEGRIILLDFASALAYSRGRRWRHKAWNWLLDELLTLENIRLLRIERRLLGQPEFQLADYRRIAPWFLALLGLRSLLLLIKRPRRTARRLRALFRGARGA